MTETALPDPGQVAAPATLPRARPGYFPMLDSVRAVAAFGVLALHASARTGSFGTGAAAKFFSHGDVGVPIFFVLSGLLLYRPLARAHLGDAARAERAAGTRSFYERRFLRILPLYWFVLLFVTVVFHNVDMSSPALVARHGLLLDTYSSAWVRSGQWMQQTWSLTTEVAFYLLLPVLALGVGLIVRRVRAPRRIHAEVATCGVIALVSFGVAWWLAATRPNGTVASVWLPAQGYLFALGMILAVISVADHTTLHGALHRVAQPTWLWWAVGAGAYLVVVFGLDLPDNAFTTPETVTQQLLVRALYAVVALCLIVPAAFGGTRGLGRRVLSSAWLRWLGIISYGIFLWHLDWIKQLQDFGLYTYPSRGRVFPFVLISTVFLAVGSAALTYYLIERPLQRRAHASGATPAPTPATTP